jgi:hypothetical protein
MTDQIQLPAPLRSRNDLYRERGIAAAVAGKMALQAGHKVGVKDFFDGKKILYIDTPEGQISWAFDPADFDLLEGFSEFDGEWDGSYASRTGELLRGL